MVTAVNTRRSFTLVVLFTLVVEDDKLKGHGSANDANGGEPLSMCVYVSVELMLEDKGICSRH
jgi:hypothetical protein